MLRRFEIARKSVLGYPKLYSRAAEATKLSQYEERFKKGDVINGFVVTEVEKINEMYLEAIRLTHQRTGAEYLHLNRDDSNNVFSINFRTTPSDSTGLPHILEHMSLCGSQLYPVRDPFMKMLRRSLATFMNAMTGPDYTLYPFSTQNIKDFRNLQSIYADAVFKPRLRDLDFNQEGWRLEHSILTDKNSPIIIKGVVFNEMKGVFNENQWVFAENYLNKILPSHTYSVCSGGYPLDIPNLTHQALKDFHSRYYHPSNSRIYSYGNFPLEDHLKFLNDNYFNMYDKIDAKMSQVPSETRWSKPKREHITCRPDPFASNPQKQSLIAIGYLCNDILDIQTTLELHILSELLLKGPTSAFYKSLVETNLGSGFGPVTGYDAQCRDAMFVVSLQEVDPNDFEKIETIFNQTVNKVIEHGFEKDHIEAVLHGMELRIKHQTSNFGMNLLFNLTSLWNHNGDLIKSMKINQAIDNFNQKLQQNPKYLQNLVQKYLKDNNHRLVLTMSPDENYDAKLTVAEEKLLNKKLNECSEEDKSKIFDNGITLRADQEKQEDLTILPTLKISDLKSDVDRYDNKNINIVGVPLQISIQPTNGISYFRGILNTNKLNEDLKQLIPIFNDVIAKMGTKSHNYRSFDRLSHLKTGGLGFSNHIAERKDNILNYEEGVFISSYCLDKNANDMWKIWTELFTEVKLDDIKRFETLIKSYAGDLSNGIADSGHVYAMSSASSLVSPISQRKESISGLEFIGKMKKIVQKNDFNSILTKIQEIRQLILNKNYLRTAINLSGDHESEIIDGLGHFYSSIDGNINDEMSLITKGLNYHAGERGIHYIMPYATNYTSKAIFTVPYTHPDHPALRVVAKLISSLYLLPEVREKEGAYGSGATLGADGVFTFYSFRDPNNLKTFDTFDRTLEFLNNFNIKQTDLDESKLGIFQKIDAPVSPSSRGLLQFTHGLTDDDRQLQRTRLQNVTIDDLLRVAKIYLNPNGSNLPIGRAIIGPANSDLINRKSQNWTVITQDDN